MFDKEMVLAVLSQIDEALEKIVHRTVNIKSADDFTDSPEGMEKTSKPPSDIESGLLVA